MVRLSLILMLALAACAPYRPQDATGPLSPSDMAESAGQVVSQNTSSPDATTAGSPEAQQLERVGARILAVAASVCGTLDAGSEAAESAQSAEHAAKAEDCDYPLRISEESDINAFTDGRRVRITRRLVRFAASDAELAFTIAHEVAHNLLGHKSRTLFGDPKRLEYDADRLGLQLIARAGYDVQAAVRFLRRLASSHPHRDRPNAYYPSFSKRAEVLSDLAGDMEPRLSSTEPEENAKPRFTAASNGF